ncbi:FAD/NAD(P)-binding domain-containing protein [Karstenula rhodostoma CBS 690.94]|uniref:FAD/NAD(P)-binding domain-containing protein n=1 Tax=Karstenula rhodostoma CBS 690.94 TaxID=1392251 RepID=A0A9P4PXR3_9PLEO|nr:FAD/NAD(P)-binding domain-containing protein [Karstenula rhodostoma CBS 690.94]
MSANQTTTIAIIGGGLAGATLANALLKHPHLTTHIFESAPEFSARGAAVGIDMNAQAALAEIGGAAADAVERAGGVLVTSSRLLMGAGPHALETVFDLAPSQRGKVVHRAALLSELLKSIDDSRKHVIKKVLRIERSHSSQLAIHFEDGTVFHAHAVIGADGVRGHVRRHVLGAEHPAVSARRSRFWDARSLVSIDKAREVLGGEYFAEPRQYGYVGDGAFFMHDKHDDGEMVQFVVTGLIGFEDAIKGCFEPSLRDSIVEAFPQPHHEVDAPTYINGYVCIMGDAAHCMTSWQGSGAAQALEDAMILDTLLGQVKYVSDIPAVVRAYNHVRRCRTQRIVHSSAETGLIMCGRGTDTGLDIGKVQQLLPGQWHFIYDHDHAKHKQAALRSFDQQFNH